MNVSEDTTMEVPQQLSRYVDVNAASRLGLDHDVVHTVVLRSLHDGIPFVLTAVHLPESLAGLVFDSPELVAAALGTNTVNGALERRLTALIAQAAQLITVGAADQPVSDTVICWPGHPMLRVDRLYSDTTGAPVEFSVSHFLAEQSTYRVSLRCSSASR